MGVCFFMGHRDADISVYPVLLKTVERYIVKERVTEFIVGQYGAFDRMAAKAVIALKARHPLIKLTLLLPFHPAFRPIALPHGFDASLYPFETTIVPRRFAIIKANEQMLTRMSHLIAYVTYAPSNAARFLARSKRKGSIIVVNVAEEL